MKIERVETILADRWGFVEIHTEEGITGLGEVGVHAYPEACAAVLVVWAPYLQGKDPLQIEHHWQTLYRYAHFRGAAIGGALAAIDIALWDIAGKHFGVPAYQLLGGKCRDRVRLYLHIDAATPESLAQNAAAAVAQGFTAVRFTPFASDYPARRADQIIADAVERVGAVRETVGTGVDVCVEIHRRLQPVEAIALAQELAQFRPFFYEDPTLPDSVQTMGDIQRQIPIPIATGERLHTIQEFRELLVAGGASYIRPDLCLAGGLTHCKKIAAVAEAFHVGVIPHNPLSPVSTAACVQLDACIPNFVLQEYTGRGEAGDSSQPGILQEPLRLERGYLVVPDAPGIGVALNHEAIQQMPFQRRVIDTPIHEDGSVADR